MLISLGLLDLVPESETMTSGTKPAGQLLFNSVLEHSLTPPERKNLGREEFNLAYDLGTIFVSSF